MKVSVRFDTRMLRLAVLLSVVVLFVGTTVNAADKAEENMDELAEQTEAAAEALGGRRFFVMPVPIANPTVGAGLGVVTMRLFQAGENARPSNFMIGGFWADSDSWAGGAGATVYTTNDIYRFSGWIGYWDANLKFYGIGNEAGDRDRYIKINQWGPFFAPKALRRVADNWYVGARYRFMTVTTRLPDWPEWLPGDILRDGFKITSSGLGVVAEYDSRDNEFTPLSGAYFEVATNFAMTAIGSDRNYQQFDLAYNFYHELADNHLLAWRATACGIGGDAPFYDICSIGSFDQIRGYVGGQYRDEVSLTTQLEYRWKFYRKWGMVAFAGVGQVAPSLSEISGDNLLPSYGVGIRFMASEENRVNLGIDYARGKDSDAWYFRIGEVF